VSGSPARAGLPTACQIDTVLFDHEISRRWLANTAGILLGNILRNQILSAH
jgi:hypothetical protein